MTQTPETYEERRERAFLAAQKAAREASTIGSYAPDAKIASPFLPDEHQNLYYRVQAAIDAYEAVMRDAAQPASELAAYDRAIARACAAFKKNKSRMWVLKILKEYIAAEKAAQTASKRGE